MSLFIVLVTKLSLMVATVVSSLQSLASEVFRRSVFLFICCNAWSRRDESWGIFSVCDSRWVSFLRIRSNFDSVEAEFGVSFVRGGGGGGLLVGDVGVCLCAPRDEGWLLLLEVKSV